MKEPSQISKELRVPLQRIREIIRALDYLNLLTYARQGYWTFELSAHVRRLLTSYTIMEVAEITGRSYYSIYRFNRRKNKKAPESRQMKLGSILKILSIRKRGIRELFRYINKNDGKVMSSLIILGIKGDSLHTPSCERKQKKR